MDTIEIQHEVDKPYFQRMDEPFYLFGRHWDSWAWIALVCVVVGVGLFYVCWMYLRERRTIGWVWPLPLALARVCVYGLLGLIFLLPARQHWDVTSKPQTARVVLLFDTSLSMSKAHKHRGCGRWPTPRYSVSTHQTRR